MNITRWRVISAVLLSLGEVPADIFVHFRFGRVPPPASRLPDGDILKGVKIKVGKLLLADGIAAVGQGSVPEMMDSSREVGDAAAHGDGEWARPGQDVLNLPPGLRPSLGQGAELTHRSAGQIATAPAEIGRAH